MPITQTTSVLPEMELRLSVGIFLGNSQKPSKKTNLLKRSTKSPRGVAVIYSPFVFVLFVLGHFIQFKTSLVTVPARHIKCKALQALN